MSKTDDATTESLSTNATHSEDPAGTFGIDDSHEHELWKQFWLSRDLASRNNLLIAYTYVVEQVATRLPANIRGYWDIEDLKSFGILGLIEAIDRFDKDSAARRFPAYASKRVRGAIFDELRRLDWLPRTARRRVISYRVTVDSLSNEFSRPPSRKEIFSSMNITPNDGEKLLVEVQSAQLLRLDHGRNHNGESDDEQAPVRHISSNHSGDPESELLASEELVELRKAISTLPERQRTVVTLHFIAGLTQGQIGDMLGLSNSRICQIEASAIQSLRKVLDAANEFKQANELLVFGTAFAHDSKTSSLFLLRVIRAQYGGAPVQLPK